MSETNNDRRLSISEERLVWQRGPEVRWLEAWGKNAIRVRSALGEPIRLPMDVIVVDFFHWTAMGEWRFDPDAWPDPEGMVRELEEMGIQVLISIWPTVNGNADTFEEMEERNLLVRSVWGRAAQRFMGDNKPGLGIKKPVYFYDATNPEARRYLWEKVRDNYLSLGIKIWWLDCDEPEFQHYEFENVQYLAGNGEEVSSLYPNLHAKAFHDGMKEEGETDVVLLSRAGWAGIQRYGTALHE